MSPTKQAKSQSNKLKLHQVIEWRKKPWENPGSVGGQFSSNEGTVITKQIGSKH